MRQEGPLFVSPGELVISHSALAVVYVGQRGGCETGQEIKKRQTSRDMCGGVLYQHSNVTKEHFSA